MAHKIHLGITGLRRTGKTVFLTALIYQLSECGSCNLDEFKSKGVTLWPATTVSKRRSVSMKEFPYKQCLTNFRSQEPVWPEPTTGEFEYVLRFAFKNPGTGYGLRALLGKRRPEGAIELHLHDYPGECLLDIVMIGQDFRMWSESTLTRMEIQCPKETLRYYEACKKVEHANPHDVFRVLQEEYGRYVMTARKAELEFIQPGTSLIDWFERVRANHGEFVVPSRKELPFVPLTEPLLSRPGLYAMMCGSYQDYVGRVVEPFFKRIQRCRTQVVLVDILRILKHGVGTFNDTRDCIADILQAFYSAQRPFGGPNPFSKGDGRIIFAATKADQASKKSRANMGNLLDSLVETAKGKVTLGEMAVGKFKRRPRKTVAILSNEWFTSIRATDDARRDQKNGEPIDVLKGLRKGDHKPAKEYFPGEVPYEWPSGDEGIDNFKWILGNQRFGFTEFEPTPLSKRNGATLQHINLDRVVWRILEDCF